MAYERRIAARAAFPRGAPSLILPFMVRWESPPVALARPGRVRPAPDAGGPATGGDAGGDRYLGIDVGAETVKVVEVTRDGDRLRWTRRELVEHDKAPERALLALLARFDWSAVRGASVSGRFARHVRLPRIPAKAALSRAARFLHGEEPMTVVSVGGRGFAVLERRTQGTEVLRENGRCSQGTGSFLRQLVGRFGLSIEEASRLVEDVAAPAALSGRCPVILKTDMTHLANRGESRAAILAGLFDALCENVETLVKPRVAPPLVLLVGGVSRSRRVREHFARFLSRHEMSLLPLPAEDGPFVEALGCALLAAESPERAPSLDRLVDDAPPPILPRLPGLADSLPLVRRLPRVPPPALDDGLARRLVLGFDVGSTGSKLVALDVERRERVSDHYVETAGDPVGAAQRLVRAFLDGPAGRLPVVGFGATGSGREIVGSLLAACHGAGSTFVLNEIAAHAAGALRHDPAVDTIFELGGQDAKYIRLEEGRVVDAAMNETCSAGTGSFIAEQGRRFASVRDVVHLGEEALAADEGVSLGQHCSVFMAEVVDEAVAQGVPTRSIVAGIYDAVVLNFLNRVKGNRTVGSVVFCQGMPFASPALAAAVARQTGRRVVVPPDPGTIGALGIALLAAAELDLASASALPLDRFLATRVERKETTVCGSTRGCGGSGNHCRIDHLHLAEGGVRRRLAWGGACSLHDAGTRRRRLPDRSPDPFRERAELVREVVASLAAPRGGPSVALTDEFVLKALLPFFATFFHGLGLDVRVRSGADRATLRRGAERANVPFCAPMQQYHGMASAMAEERPDFVFLPMLRSLPRAVDEPRAVGCPISQGSADLLRLDLAGGGDRPRLVTTCLDFGPESLRSAEFRAGCVRLAAEVGASPLAVEGAFARAVEAQERFDRACLDLGRRALEFAAAHGIVPVVVLGRPYTIHNDVLNSNVPALLREQGALPVPVDCYPLDDDVPVVPDVYWGHGQRILRAAHQVRRRPGVYGVLCSNYACGPDGFLLHLHAYAMQGKPFAVIETDGHAGDVGTKTRLEAFLYCVEQDRARARAADAPRELERLLRRTTLPADLRRRGDLVLVPPMSRSAEVLAAALRRYGLAAEALPTPDAAALRAGRRLTSGKECLPMALTLGSFLTRIEADPDRRRRFALLMPRSSGPCRLGAYRSLLLALLEHLGRDDRVGVFSPEDSDYYAGVGRGFSTYAVTAITASSMLAEALCDVRPVERAPGAAREIFERYQRELVGRLERGTSNPWAPGRALVEVASGRLFGCRDLLRRAGREFAAARGERDLPVVRFVGEIYVRCDPFANDRLVEQLERRGMRVRFASAAEWFEYVSDLALVRGDRTGPAARLSNRLQHRLFDVCHRAIGAPLSWPRRVTAREAVRAASAYVREELFGEAVLTLGGPIQEWRDGEIDAAVSVGPLECMPTKLAESQFFHVAEREGLRTLTVALNGDAVDPAVLDNFAYEVHEDFRRRRAGGGRGSRARAAGARVEARAGA